MNPADKPPAYPGDIPTTNYKPLVNEGYSPSQDVPQNAYNQPMHNVYSPQNNPQYPGAFPYGNIPQPQSQFVFASVQQPTPVVQPSTTVNVNTGPVEKRYCCSCCCTCFWIIVIIFIISAIIHASTM